MSREYVSWNESLSIGVQDMDDQHRVLLDLINQVWQGLVSQHPMQEIDGVVLDLEEYTRTHFGQEEALMEHHAYPGLASHKESHALFIAKVNDLETRIAAGETIGLELLRFLSDWLTFHISMVDRQYANFIRAKESQASTGS